MDSRCYAIIVCIKDFRLGGVLEERKPKKTFLADYVTYETGHEIAVG